MPYKYSKAGTAPVQVYIDIPLDTPEFTHLSDAEQFLAKVEALVLVAHLCDQVAAMQDRINRLADALETRQRADAEAARQEAERRRALEEDPLEDPPDIAEYQARNPPSEIGDDTHQPGGELHAVAAKEEGKEPEPDLEVEDDELCDLPEELRDLPDPFPEPKGSVHPQPVAISLNKE